MKKHPFIEQIRRYAVKLNNTMGIKASLTIAQACLESGFGRFTPPNSNNIFGIKWRTGDTGPYVASKTREYINGQWIVTEARFRKYSSYYDSLLDHANLLLKNSRYKKVVTAPNGIEACREIQKAGYATDPKYADKLINIVELYGLEAFDKQNTKMLMEVITKNGQSKEMPLDKTQNINGHIYVEARELALLVGGKVSFDAAENKAVFDFSNK